MLTLFVLILHNTVILIRDFCPINLTWPVFIVVVSISLFSLSSTLSEQDIKQSMILRFSLTTNESVLTVGFAFTAGLVCNKTVDSANWFQIRCSQTGP